jgi:hypothetical protein
VRPLDAAALAGDVAAVRRLLAAGEPVDGETVTPLWLACAGARTDIRDTLWNGTPLGWAIHKHRARARTHLERISA